jgi:succinyl-CoA synthetase alpha subunit
VLDMFDQDPLTEQVVLIGEIGGSGEEQAAEFIARRKNGAGHKDSVRRSDGGKPVIAFVAGRTAPEGKRMGHAGAIVEGGSGTALAKIAALEAAGVPVVEYPEQIPDLLMERA